MATYVDLDQAQCMYDMIMLLFICMFVLVDANKSSLFLLLFKLNDKLSVRERLGIEDVL